jgi:hypothetical protein
MNTRVLIRVHPWPLILLCLLDGDAHDSYTPTLWLAGGAANAPRGWCREARRHVASELVAFQLMPLEPQFKKPIAANWSYRVADMDRCLEYQAGRARRAKVGGVALR